MLATVISARCSSSRLPNKTLREIIPGYSSIDIVITRAKQIGLPVILATSLDATDNDLEDVCKKHKIKIFRGSLENKIKRWNDCFEKFDIDFAIQIDGDDLCYDFEMGKSAIKEIQLEEFDLLTCKKEVITGLFTFAITRNAMKLLYSVARNESINTDIIVKFIEKAKLRIGYLEYSELEMNKDIRLTLDYQEDLEFFKKVYTLNNITTPTRNIISFLTENPDIPKINFHKQIDFLENQKMFNDSTQL